MRTAKDGQRLSAVMRGALALYTPPGHAASHDRTRELHNYVRAIRGGNQAYLVMLRPPALKVIEHPLFVLAWVHNLRADLRVALRMGRRAVAGRAREITSPTELERARDAICRSVNLINFGEALLHLRGLPSRRKIMNMHRHRFETGIPLVVDLSLPTSESAGR